MSQRFGGGLNRAFLSVEPIMRGERFCVSVQSEPPGGMGLMATYSHREGFVLAKTSGLSKKVQIIGIGDDGLEGLTATARQRAEQAELLIGSRQSLAAVSTNRGEKIEIGGDLEALVRKIEEAGNKQIVVLTTGDP